MTRETIAQKTTLSRRNFLALGTAAAAAAVGAGLASGCAPSGSDDPSLASSGSSALTPGTYEATANGFNGPVTAAVTVGTDRIESIELTECRETDGVGRLGLDTMIERVIEHQSIAVDTVSGATASSMALATILEDALSQAGADVSAFSTPTTIEYAGPDATDVSTKVVILGGGGAGMTLASRLARKGVPVILVEKRQMLGGTSSRAGYQLMGVESRAQKESTEIPFKTPDDYYNQYIAYDSKGVIDPEMLRMHSQNIGPIMDWVRFDLGVPMDQVEPGGMAIMLSKEYLAAGHKWGGVFTTQLMKEMERLGVDCRLETRATELITKDGAVTGVKVEAPNGSYTISADAVVVATGAFGSNDEMVQQYLPNWVGYPSNEVPEATGDGILMGQQIGASLKGMDEDHLVVYTACVKIGENQTLPVSVRAAGGIIVNVEGRRFHDELDMQLINLALAAKEQTDERYFGIVDQAWVDAMGPVKNAVSADTIADLAKQLGIDPAGLEAEVAHYNDMFEQGEDTDFHRLSINFPVATAPFYGVELYTGLHGFDGGLEVDHRMQVLKEDGSIYPGLYATGGGVDFSLATVSAMTGKIFTATLLADTLIEDLGY